VQTGDRRALALNRKARPASTGEAYLVKASRRMLFVRTIAPCAACVRLSILYGQGHLFAKILLNGIANNQENNYECDQ
jgi:hypothetical protein